MLCLISICRAAGAKVTTYYKDEKDGHVYGFMPSWRKTSQRRQNEAIIQKVMGKTCRIRYEETEFAKKGN